MLLSRCKVAVSHMPLYTPRSLSLPASLYAIPVASRMLSVLQMRLASWRYSSCRSLTPATLSAWRALSLCRANSPLASSPLVVNVLFPSDADRRRVRVLRDGRGNRSRSTSRLEPRARNRCDSSPRSQSGNLRRLSY